MSSQEMKTTSIPLQYTLYFILGEEKCPEEKWWKQLLSSSYSKQWDPSLVSPSKRKWMTLLFERANPAKPAKPAKQRTMIRQHQQGVEQTLVGFVTGFVWADMYIAWVEIRPDRRGKGLCGPMMEFTFRNLKEKLDSGDIKIRKKRISLQNTGGIASFKCYKKAAAKAGWKYGCEDRVQQYDKTQDNCEEMTFSI